MQYYTTYGAVNFCSECVYVVVIDWNVSLISSSCSLGLHRGSQWISKSLQNYITYEDL